MNKSCPRTSRHQPLVNNSNFCRHGLLMPGGGKNYPALKSLAECHGTTFWRGGSIGELSQLEPICTTTNITHCKNSLSLGKLRHAARGHARHFAASNCCIGQLASTSCSRQVSFPHQQRPLLGWRNRESHQHPFSNTTTNKESFLQWVRQYRCDTEAIMEVLHLHNIEKFGFKGGKTTKGTGKANAGSTARSSAPPRPASSSSNEWASAWSTWQWHS